MKTSNVSLKINRVNLENSVPGSLDRKNTGKIPDIITFYTNYFTSQKCPVLIKLAGKIFDKIPKTLIGKIFHDFIFGRFQKKKN